MRPPGYEPGELPTAPLRDIQLRQRENRFSIAMQRYCFFPIQQNILRTNSYFACIINIYQLVRDVYEQQFTPFVIDFENK